MFRLKAPKVGLYGCEKTRSGVGYYAYKARQALKDKFFTKNWTELIIELAPSSSKGILVADPENHAYEIAKTITSYFGLFDADDPDWNDPITTLLEKILGIRGIDSPDVYTENDWLLEDLRIIGQIIDSYEDDEFINRLKKENIKPRNHEERIKADFYQRCKEEQSYIISELLRKAPTFSIWRSGNPIPQQLQPDGYYFYISDLYSFKTPLDWQDFDHRNIDNISHRLESVPSEHWIRLKKLYISNKDLFYQELIHYLPPKKVFKDIRKIIAQLPLQTDRAPLFKEMAALYQSQHWIGLFAIALPQIEGLFTEMVEALAQDKNRLKSLSDKVAYVRKQSYLPRAYFDYFQYDVPRLRNKFMHAGYADDDYRLHAMDLLYDLHHILAMFNELSNNYIIISKIIRFRSSPYFETIDGISFFLEGTASLTNDQWQKIEKEYSQFEKILSADRHVLTLVEQIVETLPNCCTKFEELLNKNLQDTGTSFTNLTLNKKKELQLDNVTCHALQKLITGQLFEMTFVVRFMNYFAKHLPSLPASLTKQLFELKTQYRRHITIYNAIHNWRSSPL